MKLRYDLHLHSCLSPCGADDMTPANMVGMCRLAGLDVIALTDHNTTGNCRAFCRAAERMGLLALPGMELTTREEVHVVCLFPELEQAEGFGEEVYRHLPERENDPAVFGCQILMDDQDLVLGEEERLLAGSTDLSMEQAAALVRRWGGLAYPAHIDRPSFSLISNLGFWSPEPGFPLAELSPRADQAEWRKRPDLRGVPFVVSSDAHYLHEIPDASHTLSTAERTPQAVIDALEHLDGDV